MIDNVHERLSGRIPDQGPATIVHGDYRLDNMILSPAGEVSAVVDWELCTLGDPLADVGMLMVYWGQPGDELIPLHDVPTTAPGFPRREDVRDRYAEHMRELQVRNGVPDEIFHAVVAGADDLVVRRLREGGDLLELEPTLLYLQVSLLGGPEAGDSAVEPH